MNPSADEDAPIQSANWALTTVAIFFSGASMIRRIVSVCGLFALLVGCNQEPYRVAPVSGHVTLDGKPVAQVAVMFQPVAPEGNVNPGPGSFGITDEEGRYSLKLVGKETPGGVVGKHKVRFDPYSDEPSDPTSDRPFRPKKAMPKIPAKYNHVEALFEFDVPPKGTAAADFQLSSQ
jgi:hypothetical protein